jgi:hypothetical protein
MFVKKGGPLSPPFLHLWNGAIRRLDCYTRVPHSHPRVRSKPEGFCRFRYTRWYCLNHSMNLGTPTLMGVVGA